MKKILIIFILIGFSFGLFSSYFLPDSAATLTYGEVKTIPGYVFVIDNGTTEAASFIKADKSFYTIDDKFTITGNVGKIIPGETFKIGFHKPDGNKVFSSTVITPRSDGSFTYGSTVTSFFFSPVGTWKISMEYGSIYAEDIFQVSAPTSIQEDKSEFTEERKEKYESNTLTGFAFIAIIAIIIIAVIVIKRRR